MNDDENRRAKARKRGVAAVQVYEFEHGIISKPILYSLFKLELKPYAFQAHGSNKLSTCTPTPLNAVHAVPTGRTLVAGARDRLRAARGGGAGASVRREAGVAPRGATSIVFTTHRNY